MCFLIKNYFDDDNFFYVYDRFWCRIKIFLLNMYNLFKNSGFLVIFVQYSVFFFLISQFLGFLA